jgi:pyruvate formate lyase activating enzyme
MTIGGFQSFSLSEYAGKISAIVFFQGCNFRCPFCHNPELVEPNSYATPISKEKVIEFLRRRSDRLEAVCLSGGEPTLQTDLYDFVREARSVGLRVKLETNGSRPDTLAEMLDSRLLDFVSLDVKAPLERYERAVHASVDPADIARSVALVISSGVPHEMRTTFHEGILSLCDLRSIGELVQGCQAFALQRMRLGVTLDPLLGEMSETSESAINEALALLESLGIPCTVR